MTLITGQIIHHRYRIDAPLAVCRRESAFPGGPNGDKMACIPAPGSF